MLRWVLTVALAALSPAAHAVTLEELRLGATQHNIIVFDDKIGYKEEGPNVEAELVFDSPTSLRWLGSPRPYVMASYNTHGRTSWAGAGLYWRWQFAENWAFEPGIGYVLQTARSTSRIRRGTRAIPSSPTRMSCWGRAISSATRWRSNGASVPRSPYRFSMSTSATARSSGRAATRAWTSWDFAA